MNEFFIKDNLQVKKSKVSKHKLNYLKFLTKGNIKLNNQILNFILDFTFSNNGNIPLIDDFYSNNQYLDKLIEF